MAYETYIEDLKAGSDFKRRKAVQELGKLGDKRAVGALTDALGDSNSSVRDNAAFALGELGEVESVPYLARTLKDKDEWVRKSAAKAIGMIGEGVGNSLEIRDASNLLVSALEDPSYIVRKSAARSLGQIGRAEAVAHLRKAAQDESVVVQEQARESLKKLKNRGFGP